MFFIRLGNEFSLHEVKTIAQRILDWDKKHHQLTEDDIAKLTYIVTPTLERGQHETEIRRLCLELQEHLHLKDDKGHDLRFMMDEAQGYLYFGDEAGLAEAKLLNG